MPRINRNFVFTLVRDLKAFLRLDAGVGRSVPDAPEKQIQRLRQRLQQEQGMRRQAEKKLKWAHLALPKSDRSIDRSEKQIQRLRQRLQQEQGMRRQAEKKLKWAHLALPKSDRSIDRFQIFDTLISPLKPGKMLDLAAGHGNFSLVAARLGWEVTAVDARTMRTPDPEVEEDPNRAELIRSVRWVVADVREFPIRSGEYDLICIFGLLHHLEVDDQIKLLRRCSDTLTLLTTRVAPKIAGTEGPYEGGYWREHGETREERDQIPYASWGNEVSFWHTEESLLRLVRDCGYSKVMFMRPPHKHNYTFYLCLPPPKPKPQTL